MTLKPVFNKKKPCPKTAETPGSIKQPFTSTKASDFTLIENAYWSSLKRKIRQAVLDGEIHQVEKFLASGADPNARYEHGVTLLMIAANLNNHFMIELLSEFGADFDISDDQGKTARDYTTSRETSDILEHFRKVKIVSSIIWAEDLSN